MKKKKQIFRSVLAMLLAVAMVAGTPIGALAENVVVMDEIVTSPDGTELDETPVTETEIEDENQNAEQTVSVNEVSEEMVSGSEVSENEVIEHSEFEYQLSGAQLSEKAALTEVLGELAGLTVGEDYASEQVYFEADSEEEAELIAQGYQAELLSFEEGIGVLEVPQEATVAGMIADAADTSNSLPPVYPDYVCEIYSEEGTEQDVPDELYGSQMYPTSLSTDCPEQYHHTVLGTESAWEMTKGAGVKVAVIDTGISQTHVNLVDNIVEAKAFGKLSSPEDLNGHGSHVAGLIAAKKLNGVAGVAPEAKIYAYSVADNSGGRFNMSNAIKATKYATNKKVDIINMSFGADSYSSVFEKAFNSAVNSGIIVVVAAGNDSQNMEYWPCYPACFSKAITIVATDSENEKAYYSNYGKGCVTVAAPGSNIYSTCKDGGYATKSGTSMASPIAAGEVALILANGDLTGKKGAARATAAKKILCDTATAKDPVQYYGSGIINASKALKTIGITTKKGATYMNAGGTLQCVSSITDVTWSSSNPAVATVDSKGKVTAASVTQKTRVTITATKGVRSGSITLTIYAGKIKKIMVGDGTNITKSLKLLSRDVATTTEDDTTATLRVWTNPSADELVDYTVKSSNEKVATVSASGDTITIKTVGQKGKATITVAAQDGSGKKTTVKVSAAIPVSYIQLKNNQCTMLTLTTYPIAQGKTIKVSAVPDFMASNRKVTWNNVTSDYYTIKNGTLKCTKDAPVGTIINVTASAADGYGTTETMQFIVTKPVEKITFQSNGKSKKTIAASTNSSISGTELATNIEPTDAYNEWKIIKTSNTRVAYYSSYADKITTYRKGTCKLALTAIDGTRKKATLTVKVK